MGNIVPYKNPELIRRRCKFICRATTYQTTDGKTSSFPSIIAIDADSGIPIMYTELELYILDFRKESFKSEKTLKKRATFICSFLNYLLWHEPQIDGMQDIDLTVIRKFLEYYKTREDGIKRKSDTWKVCRLVVLDFLIAYYERHKEYVEFRYTADELVSKIIIKDSRSGKKHIVNDYAELSTKAPRDGHKKYRLLAYEHLDFMLHQARMYAPDLVFPIALGAYAGLREGEIVNLTTNSIKVLRGAYQTVSRIEIDLNQNASWNENRTLKTPTGEIKKFRTQYVYDDFTRKFLQYYEEHIARLEQYYKTDHIDMPVNGPLFLNKWGKPLTVSAYSVRLKTFFYNIFLPALEQYVIEKDIYMENAPYIEAYKKEYPGAHMFRHWFTMYLLTKKRCLAGEIMSWRGDSSVESMAEYIHANQVLDNAYEASVHYFQKCILEVDYED